MELLGTLTKNYNPSEKTNFKVIRICYKMPEEGATQPGTETNGDTFE